jgi:tRNA A-37 threonylcarbamoyl transferase component Bud32
MPRKSEIKFHHYREIAAMATWWKAIFLTPIWAFILIMPLGAFVRYFLPHVFWIPSFVLVILLGLFYFLRDLNRRFVTVTDKNVYFGMGSYSLSNLRRIKIGYAFRFFNILPTKLVLDFEEEGLMRHLDLNLASISWQDSEAMLDLLSRRVSQLKIDDDIERLLQSRKPLVVSPIQDPDHVEMKYHCRSLAEELPAVLEHTIYEWSRVVGPIGTLLLSTPIWLYFNWLLFNALRDYNDVAANQVFYDTLARYLVDLNGAASTGVSLIQQILTTITLSPFVSLGLGMLFSYGLFNFIITSRLRPNKMTINREELSLDMWAYLWSYNSTTVKWKEVESVSLRSPGGSADPKKWEIVFLGQKEKLLAKIPFSSVSSEDRARLANAIERFAPKSTVEAQLTEALRPKQDKSYTELWLQSLSSSSRTNLDPLEAGHTLKAGSYEVISTLAIGGEGIAYVAHDLRTINSGTVSDIVLKETLIPAYIDKEIQQQCVERFEREARLLKDLESEHIVGLKDYFIEDKRCYLVLEYIKGQSLRQLVAEKGALEPELVLELAKQMAEILTFLHSKQVIHRDFTPDNLIMQENGKLKLIDFNVAREWDKDDGKTGTIVGKHAYVPPEQFRGKPCEASDIYALGATLFYLTTGEDPEPISQSSLEQVNNQENASWTKLNSIIKACTVMSLKTRLANTSELNKALTREIEIEANEDSGSPRAISAESKSSELSIKIAEEQPWQT